MHCIVTRQIVIVKFTGYKTGVHMSIGLAVRSRYTDISLID